MSTTMKPPPSAPPGDDGHSGGRGETQRRILSASALLMATVLISRLLGLVRDRVIAAQFGQGLETDFYNAAFTVPDLLTYLIAGGALSSAFIPVFTKYLEQGKKNEAWRIFSVVMVVTAAVVTALVVLGEIFTPQLVQITNPGWVGPKAGYVAATVPLTRILLPTQFCFFLGGLMMGAMQAKHNFWGQSLGPIIYNLGIILGGAFLAAPLGPAGMCWGALGGAIFGNFLLQWVMLRRLGGRMVTSHLREDLKHPGVRDVWKLMLPILLGVALPSVSPLISKAFASYLGEGAQSALMNANRQMQIPLGIFAQAISIAILPTLSQMAARDDIAGMRSTVNYGLRFILFLTIPASVLMIVMALPIVQLLLQTGKFGPNESAQAANALVFYSLGIFGWSAQSILARAFYALQDSRSPVIIGTCSTVLFLLFNVLSLKITGIGDVNATRGVAGLALVTSIAAAMNASILLWRLRVKLRGIEGGKLLVEVFKIAVASGVSGLVCFFLRNALQDRLFPDTAHHVARQSLLLLAACFSASCLTYLLCALLLRMEEIKPLLRILRRRRG
ncbi:MAG TPA: murein biosynthesis integral membrane protein MurJ [Chthonomonadaceae bacterium]|nr:murein biosynthesis integral membrane protein MurJ [Chthonomonadaceae bacterium]